MMCLGGTSNEDLDSADFYRILLDGPREHMISQIHPWANALLLGGKLQRRYRADLLPGVCGGALGEASGTVSVHLPEQGRPQGASFSAGDLSLHPRDPSRAQSCRPLSILQTTRTRRQWQQLRG